MDKCWEDFETGEIHVRDKWQFELKSEFIPIPTQQKSVFSQEFYVFIPNSLQINDQTYSKVKFYEDQTNLIRYKTPKFSFLGLINKANKSSPLIRLSQFEGQPANPDERPMLERELKLFANVFRSTLRDSVHACVEEIRHTSDPASLKNLSNDIRALLEQVSETMHMYTQGTVKLLAVWGDRDFLKLIGYVRDYVSISLNRSLSILLEEIRQLHDAAFQEIDQELCNVLRNEKSYREQRNLEPLQNNQDVHQNESVLYQSGLLNKFFMDVLLLNTSRAAIDQKYRNLIGGIAAAVAMLFYILLFVWQGAVFVINSEPFILFTVILYVLKDRLKEELKTLSFNQAFKIFSDYNTEIISPTGKYVVGELKESFSFINEKDVPEQITGMRNREFHAYLETIKRPERVIHYKKSITIFQNIANKQAPRLYALNIIFRYDIHRFLSKASDPYEPHVTLDAETLEITHAELPKIYHINIILKNTWASPDGAPKTELKKFRLIIDKDGIKRVENIALDEESVR